MSDFSQLRRMMVDCQLRTYDITDRSVLAAMDDVPRHLFVPDGQEEMAYLDRPAMLNTAGRALMTPMVVGRMIQSLDIQPGEHVVDYAGGTGYSAAVLAHMGASVSMIEPDPDLVARARAVLTGLGLGDAGLLGSGIGQIDIFSSIHSVKRKADAILVNGSVSSRPESLFKLLSANGRLVVVQGAGRAGRVMLYQNAGGQIAGRQVFDASAPVLAEFLPKPVFAF
jgi:protein-L-isoaspartate(D-aspartate) O-methyltransferase